MSCHPAVLMQVMTKTAPECSASHLISSSCLWIHLLANKTSAWQMPHNQQGTWLNFAQNSLNQQQESAAVLCTSSWICTHDCSATVHAYRISEQVCWHSMQSLTPRNVSSRECLSAPGTHSFLDLEGRQASLDKAVEICSFLQGMQGLVSMWRVSCQLLQLCHAVHHQLQQSRRACADITQLVEDIKVKPEY